MNALSQQLRNRAPEFSRRQPRCAFTLLELLLVLALMVAIATLVTPNVNDILARQRVRGAAETLRIEWDEARLKAMRTGQAQIFRCEPGTSNYTIQPLTRAEDATNAGEGATVVLAGGAVVETETSNFGTMTTTAAETPQTKTLADTIEFVSCVVSSDMRAFAAASETQQAGSTLNTDTISQVVVFYPDGSTSTAEVQMKNTRGDVRGVQLRGLTGQARVVDISSVSSGGEEQS